MYVYIIYVCMCMCVYIYKIPKKILKLLFLEGKYSTELASAGSAVKKGKLHPCTGTEDLYRPYGP